MDDVREPSDEKRVDLGSELGMTRRDLLRRGALVGGTLLWVAPAIQSFGSKALAQDGQPTPGRCAACYCWSPFAQKQAPTKNRGADGTLGDPGLASSTDCDDWCKHTGPYAGGGGAPGGPYEGSEFCSGTVGGSCDTNTAIEPGTNGAFCS